MATSKQERKFSNNFVAKHFNTFNRSVIQMDARFKRDSRKNKSWQKEYKV